MTAEAGRAPLGQPERCPSCGGRVARDQDWCLECGVAARTRVARPPNWRVPVVVVAAILALSAAALAFAFVALTGNDDPIPASSTPSVDAPAQP